MPVRASLPPAAAEPGFTDLAGCNSDFRAAIAWAAEKGIATGVTATAFQPDRAIDRQQAMAILFPAAAAASPRTPWPPEHCHPGPDRGDPGALCGENAVTFQ